MRRQSASPSQHGFRAIARITFSHDVLDVHLDGVFREIEPCGDELIREAKLQFRQHLLLAGSVVRPILVGGSASVPGRICGQKTARARRFET